MPDKFKIATAILATVVAFDQIVGERNRRAAKINHAAYMELCEEYMRTCRQHDYLVNKLNEYEIPMTDFDQIVHQSLL